MFKFFFFYFGVQCFYNINVVLFNIFRETDFFKILSILTNKNLTDSNYSVYTIVIFDFQIMFINNYIKYYNYKSCP